MSLRPYRSAGLLLLAYGLATQLAHTLLYTIVAYLVSAADKRGTEFGNTVNEIAGQYHFVAFSLSALLVAFTTWRADRALYRFEPFWNAPHKPFWRLDRTTKEELVRGLSSALVVAITYLGLFTLSGHGSFLGIYLTSTFGTPIFPLFFVNIAALGTMLFAEEYLFRHKIQRPLLTRLPPIATVFTAAALQLLVKHWQFELVGMDYLNLGLVYLALGFFYLRSEKSHRGLSFLLGLTFFLHPIAGLPLWGNESPSFFLFKPIAAVPDLLFGGGAPLASLALSSVLCVFVGRSWYAWRKDLQIHR